MSAFTVEQKSQLAKLMATENLTVQHQKIRTARFDPKNRVLYLPIWQNMSGDLYDLLCGHEVGHALYTPAEGWHDAVTDKTKDKNFKSFLNVVEDARIEKKVKRKYPGLKSSFQKAYSELNARDFFGIKGKDVNSMAFINRLNLFTKSQYTATWIKFTPEEQKFLDKVEKLETWEDVVSLTGAIFDYSKDEQYDMQQQEYEMLAQGAYDYDEYEDDGYDFDESEDEPDQSGSESADTKADSNNDGEESTDDNDGDGVGEETDKQSKSKADAESDGDAKEDNQQESGDDTGSKLNRFKDSEVSTKDQFSPKCETDEAFRANEDQLLDEKCKEYIYMNIPQPILKNIITPAKRVQELLTNHFDEEIKAYVGEEKVKKWVNDFKSKNERYVGLLAKEFEMRKAAKAFSKSKLSDTGDIDINKLASYKFDDNIFRKVMMVPKGKNHGLVLLLDRSGSMSQNMSGSIEQILVLAMFCRKVNIPFIVYGFGDNMDGRVIDTGINRYDYRASDYPCFENNVGDIGLDTVYLREYINSKMSNAEFTKAMRNMILLKKSFETRGRYWTGEIGRPNVEELSNTPMTQAIVAVASVMKHFKQVNNLDMTSLVIVHDGDADRTNRYIVEVEDTHYQTGAKTMRKRMMGFDSRYVNGIVVDRKNKFQKKIDSEYSGMNETILDWFRQTTGSKVFGFFLVPGNGGYIKNAIYNNFTFEDGKTFTDIRNNNRGDYSWYETQKNLIKTFKSEKFLVSNRKGFNSFYLVVGGEDLKTENDEIEIDGKFTANKLKNAFIKMNKKKQVNRILVSKFIQGIAA
jgi:cobalamin biosynthesis protein CobT